MFLTYFKNYAARSLQAIPQYDYNKLSVMYKASKHHSQETREDITFLSPLEQTNQLVPQMSAEYQSNFRAIHGHYSQARQRLDKARQKEAQSKLAIGLDVSKLEVYSSKDNADHIPKDLGYFSKSLELKQVANFIDTLDKYIIR